MNIEKVRSLFTLFSGEVYDEHLGPFLESAQLELEKMLLPDADTADVRLEFLCAALMNFRYRQAMGAADRSEYTYAGKMNAAGDKKAVDLSENLLRDYIRLCEELINASDFVFMGAG